MALMRHGAYEIIVEVFRKFLNDLVNDERLVCWIKGRCVDSNFSIYY